MMKNITKKIRNITLFVVLAVLYTLIISFSNVIGYNYEYVNVTSTVNITNAYPIITSITVSPNVLLNAGGTKIVYCNATMYDWNGFGDIILVNATLWENSSYTQAGADNNNSHYTNTTCTQNTTGGTYYANFSCSFSVWYYANASTNWVCNVSVIDTYNLTDAEVNTTTFQQYYALNVTPVIDYGNLAVGDYSSGNTTANITNFGNMPINISVNGTDMNCSIAGKIPVDYQHFSINQSLNYDLKQNLTYAMQNITNLTVPKRVTTQDWNITYWHLLVPVSENPAGICNGTVVFTAVAG